jgi:hypothetical protein
MRPDGRILQKDSDKIVEKGPVIRITDDDILRVILASEVPAVTARWVVDSIASERPSAHRRLKSYIGMVR